MNNTPYPSTETFLSLRRWIGYAGISLPWMVALLALKISPSISHSYYGNSRDWFVGSLFTIGAFLCCYFGHDRTDRIMSTIAGLCAFGVALVPTDEKTAVTLAGKLHYVFAALLFLILAWFSLVQFTKSSQAVVTGNKRKRNRIYRICGWVMLGCLGTLLLLKMTGLGDRLDAWNVTFWLETVALEAFGFSWLIKGEFILKDEAPG